MSQEEHECLNCHDHYIGSYCPRCGQAANTSRFSMKVAAENFAEAYGMGERGMFRTILDLILRPGHLILDFLRGKRASYFAPFQAVFPARGGLPPRDTRAEYHWATAPR